MSIVFCIVRGEGGVFDLPGGPSLMERAYGSAFALMDSAYYGLLPFYGNKE
jgi:hypothetical protein